jgi:hypothetical protein
MEKELRVKKKSKPHESPNSLVSENYPKANQMLNNWTQVQVIRVKVWKI